MAGEAAAKLCAACGKDVSNLPRTKDSQGRYICATCQEQFKARQAAGPGAAGSGAGGGNMLDQLISASPMVGAHKCPNCGDPIRAGAVMCVRCGFDTRAGRTLRTRVVAEKPPRVAGPMKMPRRPGEFGPSLGALMLISIGVFGGISALGAIGPGVFLGTAFVGWLASLIAYVFAVVMAFRTGNGRMGVYGLLVVVPIVQLISLVFFIWALFAHPDKWSRALIVGTFVGGLVSTVILITAYGGSQGLMQMMGMPVQ